MIWHQKMIFFRSYHQECFHIWTIPLKGHMLSFSSFYCVQLKLIQLKLESSGVAFSSFPIPAVWTMLNYCSYLWLWNFTNKLFWIPASWLRCLWREWREKPLLKQKVFNNSLQRIEVAEFFSCSPRIIGVTTTTTTTKFSLLFYPTQKSFIIN